MPKVRTRVKNLKTGLSGLKIKKNQRQIQKHRNLHRRIPGSSSFDGDWSQDAIE